MSENEYQKRFEKILSEVNEILKKEHHYYTNLDDDLGASNNKIIEKCCLMTEGIISFKTSEFCEQHEEGWFIKITVTSNSKPYEHKFLNQGRDLNLINLSQGLNNLLEQVMYKGPKYFCDISLEVDMSGIAFIEFPIEKKLVEVAGLFRGFGKTDPMAFEYYYNKLDKFNSKIGIIDSSKNKKKYEDHLSETDRKYVEKRKRKLGPQKVDTVQNLIQEIDRIREYDMLQKMSFIEKLKYRIKKYLNK